jgi:hypothetical protein
MGTGLYNRGALHIHAGSGKAFWLLEENHPARLWIFDCITTKQYDYVMLGIVALNCLMMVIEGPHVKAGSTMDTALYWSDVGFTIVFGLEVAAKSCAYTFTRYIQDITNQARSTDSTHQHEAAVHATVC